MKVRIVLDKERCSGHGLCAANAPDVYDVDDRGYCVLRSIEVAGARVAEARRGAKACPEQALRIQED